MVEGHYCGDCYSRSNSWHICHNADYRVLIMLTAERVPEGIWVDDGITKYFIHRKNYDELIAILKEKKDDEGRTEKLLSR